MSNNGEVNERAVIEPITPMPKWDLDAVLLTVALKTAWIPTSSFTAKGLLGMYFCDGSADNRFAIKHQIVSQM